MNVTLGYHNHHTDGHIIWKLSTPDTTDLAFLIEVFFHYLDYGSYVTIGSGHDPSNGGSRKLNISYLDYPFYGNYHLSEMPEIHLLNNSAIYIEYQFSTYSYNHLWFKVTALHVAG